MHPPSQTERQALNAATPAATPLNHTTDALPTLSGRMVQASAQQLHHRPDASAVVYLTVPISDHPNAARCLPLDAHVARRLAANLLDCAAMVDRHNGGLHQTEREALDQAISGLVGLS